MRPGACPRGRRRATTTAHAFTSGSSPSRASISPSSIRNPRILTWLSARPTKSSVPSSRHAHPVAGAVQPAIAAERVVDEALGVELGAGQVAARDAEAANVQLADNAHRDRAPRAVEHVGLGVGDRSADRDRARVGGRVARDRNVVVNVVHSVGP